MALSQNNFFEPGKLKKKLEEPETAFVRRSTLAETAFVRRWKAAAHKLLYYSPDLVMKTAHRGDMRHPGLRRKKKGSREKRRRRRRDDSDASSSDGEGVQLARRSSKRDEEEP